MKIADVKIGETYLTKVSGAPVKVVAESRIEPDGHWHKQARFRVRRADNHKALDKTRAASALRPLPAPDPARQALVEGVKAARALEAEGRWTEAALAWETLAKDAGTANLPKFATRAAGYATEARSKSEVAK